MSVGINLALPRSFEAPSQAAQTKGMDERSICLSEGARSKAERLSAKGISLNVVSIFQTSIGQL